MFFLVTILALYRKKILPFEDSSSDEIGCLFSYMDKLINDGVNNQEINKCFTTNSSFVRDYSQLIETISNEHLKLESPFFDDNISEYFDLNQAILTTFPNISFFDEYKEIFIDIRPIVEDLGPDICNVISLDYNTIIKLYDYVFINKENDGIQYGKLFNILGVSSELVPKIAKILSFIDPHNEPLEVLMDGANIKSEYSQFNKIVKSLQIPKDEKERFLSLVKFIDTFSAGIDVASGVYHNFFVKYINEFFVPLFKTYIIKPINIFDRSIYERAMSLVNALVKFQQYPLSCDKPNEELTELDQQKCFAFEAIIGLISQQMPFVLDDDGQNATQPSLDRFTEQVSVFTNEEVNLTSVLIENFTISENYVKFFFGSIANLTDKSKNYVDLLEGTNLIYNETKEEEDNNDDFEIEQNDDYLGDEDENDFDFSNIPYHKYINNLTQIIKFISNLDDESNFKLLFEYLGISQYWETFSFLMEQINRDNTICNNIIMDMIQMDNETCEQMVSSIKVISELLTTTKQLLSLVNQPTKLILDGLSIIFKELDIRISLLVNLIHKALIAPILRNLANINIPKTCDYTNTIKSSGNLLTKFFTLLDEIIPTLLKKIPFIGDLITKFMTKFIEFLSLIRDNVDLATFFEFFMGGSSIITKMLKNAGNAYSNNNKITGAELAKSLQPTSFLNVYETANQINKIEDMRFKNLANSIIYDGSSPSSAKLLADSPLTFNDVLPFKTIVENSNDLSKSFKSNNLNLNLVAKSFGTGENNVKQNLNSVIKTALSPPADAILESSVSSGYDMDTVLAYLDGIGLFSKQVTNGEMVKTKTNEYIKIKKSKGLPLGAIIGIAVGAVVVVGVAVFLGVYFGVIRKRRQNDDKKEDTSPAADAKENNKNENGETI